MGKEKRRYVARAISNEGWRIWNSKMQRWWGEVFREVPEDLLNELNSLKRPQELEKLSKKYRR